MTDRVHVTGDDELERKLRFLELAVTDLRPFWPIVARLFIAWQRENFETEGAWQGQRWQRLSEAYRIFKSSVRPGKTILIFDGDLRRAASNPSRISRPGSLTLTIEDFKAGIHQEGGGRLPARPLIPETLPVHAEAELEHAASGYISEVIVRLGLG